MFRIACYLIAIVGANVITAATMPATIGPLIIPWGSYLIGIIFICRDLIQNEYGKQKAYGAIIFGLALSALVSYVLGDPLTIVFASAITFLVGETADTEIYSRVRTTIFRRIVYSGFVAGLLDSTIFVIIGLSPFGAGYIPWNAVPYAILGQTVIKFVMQFVAALVLYGFLQKDYRKAIEKGFLIAK